MARHLHGFLAGLLMVIVGAAVIDARVAEERAAQAERSTDLTRPESAAWLVEKHDCWTSEAPPDVVVPGHVVVTRDGRTWYAGRRAVALALEQVFDGIDHDLTVHAFCR